MTPPLPGTLRGRGQGVPVITSSAGILQEILLHVFFTALPSIVIGLLQRRYVDPLDYAL
jgi:hypothetical protein